VGGAPAQNVPVYWLRLILRPVMRFCLRHSLKIQDVVDTCKAALLDVAQEEIQKADQEISVSRLSVMTGIHRPDVTRLLEHQEELNPSSNLITKLIGQWQGDSRFKTASGKPRTLTFDGKQSEFADLVASVSTSLSPYTILFELERSKIVERTTQGLKLIAHEYVRRDNLKETFQYLGRDCNDLISAVEENVMSPVPNMNLHLQTEYDNVTLSSVAEIRSWFIDQGNIFHDKARKFLSKFDKDLNPKINKYEPTTRVAVCTFSKIDGDSTGEMKEPTARKR
jgi:hypothetical protein